MQSPFSKDYFDLFGLPVSYDVDSDKLAQRYRELQNTIHPDRYTTSSDQERRLSLQLTAQVNEAFQTLKMPIMRARYMLDLHNASPDQRDIAMNPEFLSEQIELRERIADIPNNRNPQDELVKIGRELEDRNKDLQKRFSQQVDIGTAEALKNAGMIFLEMQFIGKLQQELAELEMELLQ